MGGVGRQGWEGGCGRLGGRGSHSLQGEVVRRRRCGLGVVEGRECSAGIAVVVALVGMAVGAAVAAAAADAAAVVVGSCRSEVVGQAHEGHGKGFGGRFHWASRSRSGRVDAHNDRLGADSGLVLGVEVYCRS